MAQALRTGIITIVQLPQNQNIYSCRKTFWFWGNCTIMIIRVLRASPTKALRVLRASPTKALQVLRASPTKALRVLRASPTKVLRVLRASPTKVLRVLRASPAKALQHVNSSTLHGRRGSATQHTLKVNTITLRARRTRTHAPTRGACAFNRPQQRRPKKKPGACLAEKRPQRKQTC